MPLGNWQYCVIKLETGETRFIFVSMFNFHMFDIWGMHSGLISQIVFIVWLWCGMELEFCELANKEGDKVNSGEKKENAENPVNAFLVEIYFYSALDNGG